MLVSALAPPKLNGFRVRRIYGDGQVSQVSIYPLMSTSTPQSHHFALIPALGMLSAFEEP